MSDWDVAHALDDINEQVSVLTNLVMDGVERYISYMQCRHSTYPAWLSPELIGNLKKQAYGHWKYKKARLSFWYEELRSTGPFQIICWERVEIFIIRKLKSVFDSIEEIYGSAL